MTGPRRSPVARIAWRGSGALLLLVPFLPLAELFGPQPGAAGLVPPAEWALGLLLFGSAAWFLSLTGAGSAVQRVVARVSRALEGREAWLLVPLGMLLLAVSGFVFGGRPGHVDSIAQLFQARILASGLVTAPAPPGEAFFLVPNLLVDGGRWYAQYPPGHAAALAPGDRLGVPWAVPVLLSLATAWLLFGFARRAYGRTTARWTLVLLVVCPFFWFAGASFMNHVTALFCVAALLRLLVEWEVRGSGLRLIAAGCTLGALGLVRPLTAVAVAAALAPFVVRRARERRAWGAMAGCVAGAVLVGSLYLAFNALTTGSPLLTGYVRLWGESHALGFHATPWGELHTPLAGLGNELTDLSLLNLFLFEWPIPGLLPIGLYFLLGWDGTDWDRRLLLAFLALPAAYFFHWHRDAYLGPRFLYEGLAFLLPLTARALHVGGHRLAGRAGRRKERGAPTLGPSLSRLVPAHPGWPAAWLLVLCVGYAAGFGVPQRFRQHRARLAPMRVSLTDRVAEVEAERALVFVAVSWGNRLIAGLRELGLRAATTERAYRRLDHCELELLRRAAEEPGWDASLLTAEVERRLADPPLGLVRPRLNGDRSLRLRPHRALAAPCREQLERDAAGYTVYAPHLLTNRPRLDGPVVAARDLGERNGELRRRYPGRPAFLWRGDRLERLR